MSKPISKIKKDECRALIVYKPVEEKSAPISTEKDSKGMKDVEDVKRPKRKVEEIGDVDSECEKKVLEMKCSKCKVEEINKVSVDKEDESTELEEEIELLNEKCDILKKKVKTWENRAEKECKDKISWEKTAQKECDEWNRTNDLFANLQDRQSHVEHAESVLLCLGLRCPPKSTKGYLVSVAPDPLL